jgi:hypothetical protein
MPGNPYIFGLREHIDTLVCKAQIALPAHRLITYLLANRGQRRDTATLNQVSATDAPMD